MIELTDAMTGDPVALNPRYVENVRPGLNGLGSRIFTRSGNSYTVNEAMSDALDMLRREAQDRSGW